MKTVPLRGVAEVSRVVVDPALMPTQVSLFSIPALDAGSPETVTSEEIDSHKLKLMGGEVLISRLNPRKPRVHLVPEGLDCYGVASTEFVALAPTRADPRFLRYFLLTESVRQHLDSQVRSATRSHQRVEPGTIMALSVPRLGLEEQRRIADFLDDQVSRIDRIIAARREQVRALDLAAKSELAARAFEGDEFMPLRYLIQDERLGLWGSELGEDETEVRIARVADFVRPEFRVGNVPTIRSAPWTHVAPRLLRHGDVLLERSGGTQINPVGCPAYVESPDKNTVCSNFVSRLRPREEVDGRYLSLLLGALYSTRQQAPHSTQTTGIMNLNTTSYFSVRVPVRSHSEQASNGDQMEAALEDARRRQAQLNKSIDLLTEYKSSLITAAVTGELDVSTAGSSIPG